MKKPIINEAITIKDRQRVKIFFTRLKKSSLVNYMKFETSVEKVQAIIRFAEMIGVPPTYLPAMISKFRELSKTDKDKDKSDDKSDDKDKSKSKKKDKDGADNKA